jgi:hypothetical protein
MGGHRKGVMRPIAKVGIVEGEQRPGARNGGNSKAVGGHGTGVCIPVGFGSWIGVGRGEH